MNYATQHHIGKNQSSRRAATENFAPKSGEIRRMDSKTKNSKRNTKRQTEIRTQSNASNGFLKCRFVPKQEEISIIQDYKTVATIEREFYKSLSNLAGKYDITPMPTKGFKLPYNMALAMWDIENKMKNINEDWNSFKLIRNNNKIYFTKEEQYYTGTSLYYIPIVPLFKMLHGKNCKKNAQLLLSVCSYLYHIVKVPYYRKQNSYLYWMYEMHEDWIEQGDEAEEDIQELRGEFKISKIIGERIEKKLSNRKNLKMFKQRLNHFKSSCDFDHDCYKVAADAFALYTEYPNTTIFRNQPVPDKNPYSDDDNKAIGMEMYISFVADTKGSLYSNIEESVNAEFNEYESIEEPTIYISISEVEASKADFDFENRLFTLMDDLYKVLAQ